MSNVCCHAAKGQSEDHCIKPLSHSVLGVLFLLRRPQRSCRRSNVPTVEPRKCWQSSKFIIAGGLSGTSGGGRPSPRVDELNERCLWRQWENKSLYRSSQCPRYFCSVR